MRGGLMAVMAAVLVGCGGPEAPAPATPAAVPAEHDHSGWWCPEHGIPEAECSMCSRKVFRECQAKGDICDKHPKRAKSQCFACNPALREQYAQRYRAKEGKEPPEPVGQK